MKYPIRIPFEIPAISHSKSHSKSQADPTKFHKNPDKSYENPHVPWKSHVFHVNHPEIPGKSIRSTAHPSQVLFEIPWKMLKHSMQISFESHVETFEIPGKAILIHMNRSWNIPSPGHLIRNPWKNSIFLDSTPPQKNPEATLQQLRSALASETAQRQALEQDADAQSRELSQQLSDWHLGSRRPGEKKPWEKTYMVSMMGIFDEMYGVIWFEKSEDLFVWNLMKFRGVNHQTAGIFGWKPLMIYIRSGDPTWKKRMLGVLGMSHGIRHHFFSKQNYGLLFFYLFFVYSRCQFDWIPIDNSHRIHVCHIYIYTIHGSYGIGQSSIWESIGNMLERTLADFRNSVDLSIENRRKMWLLDLRWILHDFTNIHVTLPGKIWFNMVSNK